MSYNTISYANDRRRGVPYLSFLRDSFTAEEKALFAGCMREIAEVDMAAMDRSMSNEPWMHPTFERPPANHNALSAFSKKYGKYAASRFLQGLVFWQYRTIPGETILHPVRIYRDGHCLVSDEALFSSKSLPMVLDILMIRGLLGEVRKPRQGERGRKGARNHALRRAFAFVHNFLGRKKLFLITEKIRREKERKKRKERNVSVLVFECSFDDEQIASWGKKISEQKFPSLEAAFDYARSQIGEGKGVLVRPNYNEPEILPFPHFREWQSRDGGILEEIRFDRYLNSASQA